MAVKVCQRLAQRRGSRMEGFCSSIRSDRKSVHVCVRMCLPLSVQSINIIVGSLGVLIPGRCLLISRIAQAFFLLLSASLFCLSVLLSFPPTHYNLLYLHSKPSTSPTHKTRLINAFSHSRSISQRGKDSERNERTGVMDGREVEGNISQRTEEVITGGDQKRN